MNDKVSENSMFINIKSYEMSIRVWFRIQNATIDSIRAPLPVLPKYDASRINLFWTHFLSYFFVSNEMRTATLVKEFCWKMMNHLLNQITMWHQYVIVYRRGRFERWLKWLYSNLRNETKQKEMKICNLRNGNMLMICYIEIANYRFLFCKSLAYFHLANNRYLYRR